MLKYKIYFWPIFELYTKLSLLNRSVHILGPLKFPNTYNLFPNLIPLSHQHVTWYILIKSILTEILTFVVTEELSHIYVFLFT